MADADMPLEPTTIHPMACVEQGATLGAGVKIGPFCHVGADAVLGDGVELVSHVSILGRTSIGSRTRIYPQAVLGGPAQDTKHKGSITQLRIGEGCIIRESVTMHSGSDASTGITTVGANGFFLAYSHIAHDCVVGDNVIFANGATLGGHATVGDNVYIGGLRIGTRAFLGGCSAVVGDVIPYAMAAGNRAKLRGFNVVGLRRLGMARSQLLRMRELYRHLFEAGTPLVEAIESARGQFADEGPIAEILDFMSGASKRYYAVPPKRGDTDDGDQGHG
jgi:UDP-N-acetylglucosamine acyltransferase